MHSRTKSWATGLLGKQTNLRMISESRSIVPAGFPWLPYRVHTSLISFVLSYLDPQNPTILEDFKISSSARNALFRDDPAATELGSELCVHGSLLRGLGGSGLKYHLRLLTPSNVGWEYLY